MQLLVISNQSRPKVMQSCAKNTVLSRLRARRKSKMHIDLLIDSGGF